MWRDCELDFDHLRGRNTDKTEIAEALSGRKLVREAIEYFILRRLSTHLIDYFNTNPEVGR